MRQVLFTFGGLKVFGFGAMIVVAFISATWLACWRARKEKLDPEIVMDMSFWVVLIGMVGARALYCIEYWGVEIKNLWEVLQYWKGGIVFYGGVIGSTVAFLIYRRLRPFPLRPYMDVLAPSIAVGILFGRLGCFLNGCCYGDICHFPWAVSFPRPSPPWVQQFELGMIPGDAAWSLPVHPTQIYSAIDGLVLFLLLSAYYPFRRRHGEVMALLAVTYPVSRFLIEYLRNDESAFFAGLTVSQNISIALLLTGVTFWAWLRQQKSEIARDDVAANDARRLVGASSY
jgi:phosphatidylglycerol:prolipoprotein diacylglycerol transferase